MVGSPPFSDALGNTLNSVLRRNAESGALRAEARGKKVVYPDARYVDQAGRKHVGICRSRLIGFRTLVALLEAATVRYAAKGTGDKLRVIHPAEAGEYLVFLADIVVDSHVKGVAMLVESWDSMQSLS